MGASLPITRSSNRLRSKTPLPASLARSLSASSSKGSGSRGIVCTIMVVLYNSMSMTGFAENLWRGVGPTSSRSIAARTPRRRTSSSSNVSSPATVASHDDISTTRPTLHPEPASMSHTVPCMTCRHRARNVFDKHQVEATSWTTGSCVSFYCSNICICHCFTLLPIRFGLLRGDSYHEGHAFGAPT